MSYKINNLLCVGCGDCTRICAREAIQVIDYNYSIDPKLCANCGDCKKACCRNAIADTSTTL